ncbi:MAG: T9SS type A sorting domain-containing protein [Bacteroidetes bacterium]|nr:T9SS type A sorting domain-containing protein [Bacteroidota bacterium]
MMKKIVITLSVILTCVFYQTAKAQYCIAGSTVGIYTDIVPDTALYVNTSYSIDINQDGTNDILITSYFHGTLGGSGKRIENSRIYATSLNNLVGFCFWKTFCNGTNLLMPFNMSDIVSNNTYISAGYMSYLSQNALESCSNVEWIDNTDHYIGVRYATNIDTAYGWIGVQLTQYGNVHRITVKDFALERNPIVGLHELSANSLRVTAYPNPAQTQVHIKTDEAEIMQIKIVSIAGSELINTTQHIIDVSHLPNGIYFAQIKTDKGIGARKIVVQR